MKPVASVNVLGLGYIGLPTAAVLATSGVAVHGVDVNRATADAVAAGHVPFAEPDLSELVAGAVASGSLTAGVEPGVADAHILAVPTPVAEDRTPNLSFVRAATGMIASVLKAGDLVIVESTVPPGTTESVARQLAGLRPDLVGVDGVLDVDLAHCPERVLPGRIVAEITSNDRIVGGVTPAAAARARELYARFCRGEIRVTDARTAELTKLVENSYRDVNIAFANELSVVADALAVDVWELISLANRHPRVSILQPGPGVGGHCIAVDPWFIVDSAPALTPLIRTAREVNDAKPNWVIEQVRVAAAGRPGATIATLGLTFKPNVDDLRGSPAVQIVAGIAATMPDAAILAVEPHIAALPPELAGLAQVSLTGFEDAVSSADIVVLLVDHRAFRETDATALGLPDRILIDTRGTWRVRSE